MTRRTNSNLVEAFGATGGPAALGHLGLAVCSLQVAGGQVFVRAWWCVKFSSALTSLPLKWAVDAVQQGN